MAWEKGKSEGIKKITVDFACFAFGLISVLPGSQETGLQGCRLGPSRLNNFEHFFCLTYLNMSTFGVEANQD